MISPALSPVPDGMALLVLDTNFLLLHLHLLEQLRQIAPRYGITLVIPRTVMAELDGLKKGMGDAAKNARQANDWVYACLAAKSPAVRGQKLSEVRNGHLNADDAILDFCLFLNELPENILVVLVSNDNNLCAKALVENIRTVSFRPDMDAEKIASMVCDEYHIVYGGQSPPTAMALDPAEPPAPVNLEEACSLIFLQVETLMKTSIQYCMLAVYGDDLDIVRDWSVPTDLYGCATAMIRFWLPVFLDYFDAAPDKFRPFEVEGLGRNIVRTPRLYSMPRSKHELEAFVKFWLRALIGLLGNASDLNIQEILNLLIARWKSICAAVG